MGSAIKFSEYFEVFHLTWLDTLALTLSILLSTAEFLIGIALLIGLRMRITAWASFIFMSFFTLLTLYIAIANPVSDCGCFGDFVKLSNWATFYKNIFLISLAFLVFWFRKKYKPYTKPIKEWALVVFFAAVMTMVSVYCYNHLPLIDVLPFNVGTHIPSNMEIPANAPAPKYKTTLYYKKDGITKEFTLENYPTDSTWTFVDSKSVLIEGGYVPPIQNFGAFTTDGIDITQQLLTDSLVSFVFVSPDLNKIKSTTWQKINQLYEYSEKNNNHFYFLTGSPQNVIDEVNRSSKHKLPFYFTDVTTLKEMIRSNPGLILMKNGIILAKWHYSDFPTFAGEGKNLESVVLTKYFKTIELRNVYILGLMLLIILTIILFTRKESE
jgi:uncharacterized membrane protein YphA (DoxX/SURF4 family)